MGGGFSLSEVLDRNQWVFAEKVKQAIKKQTYKA